MIHIKSSYSTNYKQRLTLESWYTNLEQETLNRSQQLPGLYKRLIHKFKRALRQLIINTYTTTPIAFYKLSHFHD